MLKLTKKADYGLIALKHLAAHGTACSAKEIADAHGLPPEILAKILQRLARKGFLHSHHGMNGGYALARDPNRISALEVISAIDGPVFITSCVTERGECYQSLKCIVREPLRKVNEGIVEVLSRVTITDMADEPKLVQVQ